MEFRLNSQAQGVSGKNE